MVCLLVTDPKIACFYSRAKFFLKKIQYLAIALADLYWVYEVIVCKQNWHSSKLQARRVEKLHALSKRR
jgi:hypothetical protein